MSVPTSPGPRITYLEALLCMHHLGEVDGTGAARPYPAPEPRTSSFRQSRPAEYAPGEAFYLRFADDIRDMSRASRERLAQVFRRELQLARVSGSDEQARHYERLLRIVEATPPDDPLELR
jgi:hypothetical protein